MKSNYKTIDELVERIDQRNIDGSVANLIGVSIDKKFIPSVANVIGTDLTKYKIIERYDFAVSLMQVSRDGKIPIACQEEYEKAIMSPAYPIFRIKDTNVILPEYLEMWFMRNEFDREAAFIAVGGVRGSMPWEDFAKLKLPVPGIAEQKEIVSSYRAVTDRIALKQRINDNLAEYLDCVYMKLSQDIQETVPLSAICKYVTEKATFSDLDTAIYISTENILPDKQGISSFGTTSLSERVTPFQTKDILVSNIRPYFKKMWFATTNGGCNADVLCFRSLDKKYTYLLKSVLYQDAFFDFVMSGAKGTKMPRGDKKHIMQYQIPLLPEDALLKFNGLAFSIEQSQAQNRQEISSLSVAMDMVLTTLSR